MAQHKVVKEIAVGNAPRGSVKFTQDGRGFVSNTSTNTVSELDALTRREVARIAVGSGPRGLAIVPGERYMLVSNSGANTVSVVDLETRQELLQVAVGRDPRHMAISSDGRFAYVSIWGSGYVAKLDLEPLHRHEPESVREVARIRLGENTYPYSVNIDRSGTRLLVACNSVAEVPVIDLATDKVVARVPVPIDGARAVAFTPDNEYALVTLERRSQIAVIDMRTLEMTRTIPVGPGPRGIAVDENDNTVYCAAFSRIFDDPSIPDVAAHSLSVVHLDGVDLSTEDGKPQYEHIRVGFGPCSVSIFDPDRVSLDGERLDRAAATLTESERARA